MLTVDDLRARLPRAGRLDWIGLRTGRLPVQSVEKAEIDPLVGLLGDHGRVAPPRLTALGAGNLGAGEAPPPAPGQGSPLRAERGGRQITLLQAEHLSVIAALSGLDEVRPEQLRRNLLISGIPLLALKDRRFWVGGVLLEGTGECHPCSRMEETLGAGGYNAVRGHGGMTARVITGGPIRTGDAVRVEGA